jgi:hypothetical protein
MEINSRDDIPTKLDLQSTTKNVQWEKADAKCVIEEISTNADMESGHLNPGDIPTFYIYPWNYGLNDKSIQRNMLVKGVLQLLSNDDFVGVTAGFTPFMVYIALVLDRKPGEERTPTQEIFVNPSGNILLNAAPLLNLEYEGKYEILDEIYLPINSPSVTYNGSNMEQSGIVKTFEMFKEFWLPVRYDADYVPSPPYDFWETMVENGIAIVAFCNSTAYTPTISINARARWHEHREREIY